MNRCQFSIIFLFITIFAASNGDFIFKLTYSTPHRPTCLDRMKIVYYGNESLQFKDRFSVIPSNDQSPEIFEECKQITMESGTVAPNLNESRMEIEELGRNESVEAIVTKEKLIFYIDTSLDFFEWLAIRLKFEDFVPVDHIERLTDQCWKPPPPSTIAPTTTTTGTSLSSTTSDSTTSSSPTSSESSASPSNNNGSKTGLPLNKKPTAAPLIQATTSKAEECESLPLWVWVGIGLFSLLLAAAIVACVWFCWLAAKISGQISDIKKAKKAENEGSEKGLTLPTTISISEKKSVKSVSKKSPSKPAKSNRSIKSNKSKKALAGAAESGKEKKPAQPSSANNNPPPPPQDGGGKSQIVQTNYENLPPKI